MLYFGPRRFEYLDTDLIEWSSEQLLGSRPSARLRDRMATMQKTAINDERAEGGTTSGRRLMCMYRVALESPQDHGCNRKRKVSRSPSRAEEVISW